MAVEDKLSPVEPGTVSSQLLDPVQFTRSDFEAALLASLKHSSKNKQFPLNESLHLKRICEITLLTVRNSYFEDRSNFRKLLRKAQHASLSKFGLIEVYSFEVPLIKAKQGEFFHDRKGPEGALNLYYHLTKAEKQQKGEEKPEPKPVLLFTEEEIMKAIEGKIRRHKVFAELQSGNYYAAGVSMAVDQRTLYKRKVPMLRVVVALGSKRMHLVQKKVEKLAKRQKNARIN